MPEGYLLQVIQAEKKENQIGEGHMAKNKVGIMKIDDAKAVEFIPGIIRRTMAYNEQLMLCHFTLKKGATIPLHNHKAVQNGYIIKGKVKPIFYSWWIP